MKPEEFSAKLDALIREASTSKVPFGFIIATLEITKGTMIIHQSRAMEAMQVMAQRQADADTAKKIITPNEAN